jgi:hypothetical protein
MITEEGFYLIPILPRDIAAKLKEKPDWPSELRGEYKRLHSVFTASKAEFITWVRKDRDSRMNRTAKQILLLIIDCLNFDTGRCDPGHQFIADELGISVRTVERTIPRIAASGWISITRRGRTTTNFYRMKVPVSKIANILDYVDGLREQRAEQRERRRYYGDPTEMADHSQSDPTTVRSHDPTEMADHEPTVVSGKPMKRTREDEPANKGSCSDSREDTYPREAIPTEEREFNPWIARNVPDRSQHREAYRLLRERKMTPEVLRRLAA